MTELICIVCPKGCHLKVDEKNDYSVSGQGCQKGIAYGKNELIHPMRMLTSTVRLVNGEINRLPVKTSKEIPKDKIKMAMKLLDDIEVTAPVMLYDVVIKNILGLDVDFIATKPVNSSI